MRTIANAVTGRLNGVLHPYCIRTATVLQPDALAHELTCIEVRTLSNVVAVHLEHEAIDNRLPDVGAR